MQFIWDTRRDARVHYTRKQGVEITRGCLVKGIPIVDGVTGSDPEALIKILADPGCPPVGSLYPSGVYPCNLAILEEINPSSEPAMSADQARVEFVYRIANPSPGSAVWTLTDAGQGSYVEAYATVFGSTAISVFYKKGEPSTTTSPPADAPGNACHRKAVRGIHRFFPQRTIRATTQLVAADWNAIKTSLRLFAGYINSSQWGPSGVDARGTWMFLFPTSRTTDYGVSFSVELNFVQNTDGFYPIGLYYDPQGNHPPDCTNPALLGAPPALNTIQQRNGIVRASVSNEFDFNTAFGFNPTD